MPNTERIDSIIDTAAVKKEFDNLTEWLDKLRESIMNMGNGEGFKNMTEGMAAFRAESAKTAEAAANVKKAMESSDVAYTATTEAVQEALTANREMSAAYKDNTRSIQENAARLVDLKLRQQEISRYMKEYSADLKQGSIDFDTYNERVSVLTRKNELLKTEISQITSVFRSQNKEILAAEGSIDEMTQRLEQMRKAYKALSAEQRASPMGQQLQADTGVLHEQVLAHNKSIGNSQGNVGNYPTEGVRNFTQALTVLQKGLSENVAKLEELRQAGQGESAQAQRLSQEIGMLTTLVESQVNGFASLSMELRNTERALQTLASTGQQDTAMFRELQAQAANAARELTRFKENQKLMEATAPALQAATVAAKGLAGAYAVGAGAASMFADGDEKVQKRLNSLIAVMMVMQGLNELNELWQKKGAIATVASAAAQRIKNFVLGEGTTAQATNTSATEAGAVAEGEATVATTALSGAMVALRFALMATGIGAILVLLPMLASAFSKSSESARDNGKAIEDDAEAMKMYNEAVKSATDKMGEAVAQVDQMKEEFKLANAGVLDKKETLEHYNDTIGKTIGYAKDLNEAEKKTADQAENYIKFTMLKAEAMGLYAKAGELAAKAVEDANKNPLNNVSTGTKILGGIESVFGAGMGNVLTQQLKEGLANSADDVAGDKNLQKKFEAAANKLMEDAATLAKANKFDFAGDSGKGDKKTDTSAFDLQKALTEQAIQQAKAIAENERLSLQERSEAYSTFFNLQKKLAQDEAAQEIKTGELKGKAAQAVHVATVTKLTEIDQERNKTITGLQDKANEQYQAGLKKQAEDSAKIAEDMIKNRDERKKSELAKDKEDGQIAVDTIQQRSLEEQTALTQAYNNGAISKEVYEKRLKDIQKKYAVEAIDATIASINKQIDAMGSLNPALTAAMQKQVAELQNQKANLGKPEDITKGVRAKEVEASKEAMTAIISIEDSAFERKKARIEAEIALIDRRREAEVSAINSSTLNEQQKRSALLITEKQAAEQKAALQKQAKEEDIKKAKFDKAAAILSIAVHTAEAIAGAVAQFPLTGGMPFVAIDAAIGAAQIAAVAAKPIPQYADGTDFHPGGPAIVGEGAFSELVQTPGGTFIADKAMLLPDLAAGSKVTPINENTINDLMNIALIRSMAGRFSVEKNDNAELKQINGALKQNNRLLTKLVEKQKPPTVIFKADGNWNDYIRRSVKE